MLLSNEKFLERLRSLFELTKTKSSVFITYKRYSYAQPDTGVVDSGDGDNDDTDLKGKGKGKEATTTTGSEEDEKRYDCLVRATDGKKIKISTLIEPSSHSEFHSHITPLIKASMTSLRKKQVPKTGAQTKSKKQQKLLSSTSKGSTTTRTATKVIGPRRGPGVEKRRSKERERLRSIGKGWLLKRNSSKKVQERVGELVKGKEWMNVDDKGLLPTATAAAAEKDNNEKGPVGKKRKREAEALKRVLGEALTGKLPEEQKQERETTTEGGGGERTKKTKRMIEPFVDFP